MKRYATFLLLLSSLCAYAQNSGKLLTRNAYFEMPVNGTRREFVTKATVKGEQYDFMLDTGAPLFISKKMQDKCHFRSLLKTRTEDAGGNKVKTEIVIVDTIQFGPFIFTDIPCVVLDMERSPIGCLNISGNIGSNMLRLLYVQFDIKNGKISFADDKKLLPRSLTSAHPMRVDRQSDVYLPVKLNDNITDTIHFDSGDGTLYNMSKTCMDKCVAAYPGQVVRTGFGTMHMGIGGVGEEFPQYMLKAATIQFGDVRVSDGIVSVAGNNRSRMGRDLLNYGVLQLNYPDSTYAFESIAQNPGKPHYDYGFHPIMDDEDVLVSCVWKNSVAEQLGLQNGDRIIKIDDSDFTKMSKCDVAVGLRTIMQSERPSMTVTYVHKKRSPKTITLEKKAL